MSHNLLDEEWIPVLYHDGKLKCVGIRRAFQEADRIRQVAASNPMDRAAILRFLLALLYWCRGDPAESASSRDVFYGEWFAKLDEAQECFNLLGEGKRFYQYRSPKPERKHLSSNYLVQEVPTGTNFQHFRHSIDWREGLCPACCAMGLLRLPMFTTSGGSGKSWGVNKQPPVYVIPLGPSLANTLLLSWRELPDPDLGTPVWEKPDAQLPRRGKVPLLTGLTWLPRRVWLSDPEEPEAGCISCGRVARLIRQCEFDGLGSTKTDESGPPREWSDPHTISDGKDAIKPGSALDGRRADAGQWAKVTAGILGTREPETVTKLWVVCFATVRNDKYLEATEWEVPIRNMAGVRAVQEQTLKKIEMWEKGIAKLADKLKSFGSHHGKAGAIPSTVASVRPHLESRLSARAGELIAGNDDVWDRASDESGFMMNVIAGSLSPGCTTAAVQRRREIAGKAPGIHSRAGAAGGKNRKKEDNQ